MWADDRRGGVAIGSATAAIEKEHLLLGGARPTGLDAATAVERLLALVPVFGADLPRDPTFRAVVLEQAERLWRGDLTSALARCAA